MAGHGTVENLKNYSEYTAEEKHAFHSAGGKASAIASRKRKSLRECLSLLRDLPVKDKDTKEKIKEMGIDDDDVTYGMMVSLALTDKAMKGNVPAVRLLAEMLSENEVQGVTKLPNGSIQVNFVDPKASDAK